jgi:hypothetical protein
LGQHSTPPQQEWEEKVNPRDMIRSTRNKWFRTRENVKEGDLVLELDSKNKRCQLKMAIIIGTYPGNDGCARKVRIKNADGEYNRPIHKLCLIATKEELNDKENKLE